MPFAIDEDRMQTDPNKQQELQQKYAAMGQQYRPVVQLDPMNPPVKQIPHMEYPKVVYKHPKQAVRRIEHRNTAQELVNVTFVPAEHLTKLVQNAAELKTALSQGWVKEPYIAPPMPDANPDLYETEQPS